MKNNNTATMRNMYSASGLMQIKNEPHELGLWSSVDRQLISNTLKIACQQCKTLRGITQIYYALCLAEIIHRHGSLHCTNIIS